MPIPKDWTVGDGTDGVAVTGPGGIRVLPQQLVATNYDATDPFTVQTLRQLGQPVVPLVSAERYLSQTLAPQLEQRGYTLVDTYPYPAGSDFWRRMAAGTPMVRNEFESVAGERYRVDAGAKHYWVNAEGRYFGTDDPLYDPRTDQRVNDEQWTPFKIER